MTNMAKMGTLLNHGPLSRRSFLLSNLAIPFYSSVGSGIERSRSRSLGWTTEEIRQRLGISLVVYHGVDHFDYLLLEPIKAAGIHFLEVSDVWSKIKPPPYQFWDPRSIRELGRACRDAGLKIYSFHSNLYGKRCPFKLTSLKHIDFARQEIELLLELGGEVWLSHLDQPDGLYDLENVRGLQKLARYYEGEALKITIENLPPDHGRHDISDILQLLERVGHDQVGIAIDVGHCSEPFTMEAYRGGLNPMAVPTRARQLFLKAAPRLKHLHLHDWRYREKTGRWVDHQDPFTGKIPWIDVFQALKEVDYHGVFMFENNDLFGQSPIESVGRFPDELVSRASNSG